MAFKRLNFLKHWTNSEDFPTYEDSEAQVREDLQFHPDAIRDYLNNILLAALEDPSAMDHIGAAAGEVSGTLADVLADYLAHLERLDQSVIDLAAGEAPEAVRAAAVAFDLSHWTAAEGDYELRLTRQQHKRQNSGFGYHLQSFVGDGYRGGTWETAGTAVIYDEETGDMVLKGENPYSGRIVFLGV